MILRQVTFNQGERKNEELFKVSGICVAAGRPDGAVRCAGCMADAMEVRGGGGPEVVSGAGG